MRSSWLRAGLRLAASGLLIAGLGQVLAGVANVGSGSTALAVVGGVLAALGFFVLAHGLALTAWLGPEAREDGTYSRPSSVLRPTLYMGAAGFTVFAVGGLLGALDTSGAAGPLTTAGNALQAFGQLIVGYALIGLGLFALGSLGAELSRREKTLRAALMVAGAGFFVGTLASLLAAVGFSNTFKSIVIAANVVDAGSTAILFLAVLLAAVWGLVMGPEGVVLVERVNLRVGLLVGAVGLVCQAAGSLLSGLSLIGSGHEGVFVAGDVVLGAGLWVTAIGLAVIASLGHGVRGAVLVDARGESAEPPSGPSQWSVRPTEPTEAAPSPPGHWAVRPAKPAGGPPGHWSVRPAEPDEEGPPTATPDS